MSAAASATAPDLLHTPLHDLHVHLGARMVPFAGYAMPVQYPQGILAEHRHTRQAAGLFDVSHMGQLVLRGTDVAHALEALLPIDVIDLPIGKQRYGFFTDPEGGILDDLMLTRRADDWFMVVNAACKAQDIAHLIRHLPQSVTLEVLAEHALLALQGPRAIDVLSRLNPDVSALTFMTGAFLELDGIPVFLTRSGYTGEDGFEISVAAPQALALAQKLLSHPEVAPIGLGARDTLRLEAGLCLYGHDIDTHTTPVEAGLTWAIQKSRRTDGARAKGYPGAEHIESQRLQGPAKRRVGLISDERMPVREGAQIVDDAGQGIGTVTSGTLSPQLNRPIAMAYLSSDKATTGTSVWALVRDKRVAMTVCPLPFVTHRYVRGN